MLFPSYVRRLLPSYTPRDAATTVWALAKVAEVGIGEGWSLQQGENGSGTNRISIGSGRVGSGDSGSGRSSASRGAAESVFGGCNDKHAHADRQRAYADLLRPFVVELLSHISGLDCSAGPSTSRHPSPSLLVACNAHDMANIAVGSLRLAALLLDQGSSSALSQGVLLCLTPRVGQDRISPFQIPYVYRYVPYKTVFHIYGEVDALQI
jgi:hypothetical protein